MPKGRLITDEQILEVRRLFPNHTKKEIRSITGLGYSSIDRIQARFHLRKSAEHLHNMGVKAGKASNIARGGDSSACYTPEAVAKRVQTYKETLRREDMRLRWGLPQKTKIRFSHGTKPYRDQISYLKGLGYTIDEDKKVAYYTASTQRATRLERIKRGESKGYMRCYFDFLPYEQRLD